MTEHQNPSPVPESESTDPADFRIAYVSGVSLGKWGTAWTERNPRIRTSFTMGERDVQRRVLTDHTADVSFVRLPFDRGDDLHLIKLYEETPMVVLPKGHELLEADEIALADLAGLHLIQDPRDVPGWSEIGTEMIEGTRPDLPAPDRVVDAIELVAAGIGFVIVPQSLARLHDRKDVKHRRVTGVEPTEIGIAWRIDEDDAVRAERVEDFIGIVRGRTANSSRGRAEAEPEAPAKKKGPAQQPSKKPAPFRPRQPRKPASKKRGRR
ncbi:LysR family substrate-binding domain-containing protein [Mycetocola tolaasinivorans]|uniref:LysR family substrate-binding domain-containing protein n=1 Tax=Mycetocola tolaasinivorans TaxID=76635 RepID=UPI001600E0F1|nr:LysR family substrate-binding domain-containing protein [Mycetocola tolaasinivorans]